MNTRNVASALFKNSNVNVAYRKYVAYHIILQLLLYTKHGKITHIHLSHTKANINAAISPEHSHVRIYTQTQ